jgi:hypothetical protein
MQAMRAHTSPWLQACHGHTTRWPSVTLGAYKQCYFRFSKRVRHQFASIMTKHGYRLLPDFIDETALDNPNLNFVDIPKSANINEGLHQITFSDLAKSIDKCAWWLQNALGKGQNFPTLGYTGPHDLRYLFLVFGASKAGYKVSLLVSLLRCV